MNIFKKIKETKQALREHRLKVAENKAFKLEREAKEKKEYASLISRQEKAKSQIREARREAHPFLFGLKDSVQTKFKEANKQAKSKRNNMNVFTSSGSSTPYYLQPQKKKKNDNMPYWLK